MPQSQGFESDETEYWYNVMLQDEMPLAALAGANSTTYDVELLATLLDTVSSAGQSARGRLASLLIRCPNAFTTARSFLGIANKRAYLELSFLFSRQATSPSDPTGLCGCPPWAMSKHPMDFFLNLIAQPGPKRRRSARILANYLVDHGLLTLAASLPSDMTTLQSIQDHIVNPRELQQQRAKRRGHGCEAELARVIHQCGVAYLPPNRHVNPLGSKDPHIDMHSLNVSAGKRGTTRSFDVVVLDRRRNPRVLIQSLVHTSDPGQYGVNKSDETVQVATELASSGRSRQVEHWALLDGIGFSENKEGTLNRMIAVLDYFIQLNTLYKAPLRLHRLGLCRVEAIRFDTRYYSNDDIRAIGRRYVPKGVRIIASGRRGSKRVKAIDAGRATVFVRS